MRSRGRRDASRTQIYARIDSAPVASLARPTRSDGGRGAGHPRRGSAPAGRGQRGRRQDSSISSSGRITPTAQRSTVAPGHPAPHPRRWPPSTSTAGAEDVAFDSPTPGRAGHPSTSSSASLRSPLSNRYLCDRTRAHVRPCSAIPAQHDPPISPGATGHPSTPSVKHPPPAVHRRMQRVREPPGVPKRCPSKPASPLQPPIRSSVKAPHRSRHHLLHLCHITVLLRSCHSRLILTRTTAQEQSSAVQTSSRSGVRSPVHSDLTLTAYAC